MVVFKRLDSAILPHMETPTPVPSWLEPSPTVEQSPTPLAKYPRTAQEMTLRELTYENFFEASLDRLALGHPLKDIVDDDPRQISAADFLKWIKKDKTRHERFKESQELAAEFLVYGALKASQGSDSLNDVNRDKLIVDTSLKVAAAWSPKRYGKDVGIPTGGGGAITINIGTVESPFTAAEVVEDVTDVESKG